MTFFISGRADILGNWNETVGRRQLMRLLWRWQKEWRVLEKGTRQQHRSVKTCSTTVEPVAVDRLHIVNWQTNSVFSQLCSRSQLWTFSIRSMEFTCQKYMPNLQGFKKIKAVMKC